MRGLNCYATPTSEREMLCAEGSGEGRSEGCLWAYYIGQHVALIQGVPVSIEWTALVACGPQLQWAVPPPRLRSSCSGRTWDVIVRVLLLGPISGSVLQ
eukprot:scaffold21237_cov121-Isochrysis_galbana.AAC.4